MYICIRIEKLIINAYIIIIAIARGEGKKMEKNNFIFQQKQKGKFFEISFLQKKSEFFNSIQFRHF